MVASPGVRSGLARAEEPTPFRPDEKGDAPDVIHEDPRRPKLQLTGKPSDDRAQAQPTPFAAAGPAPVIVQPVYRGVTPGSDALPPRAPKLPLKRGQQRVTWPGFQVKEGVAEVFVELTAPVEWTVEESQGRLVYTLKNATVQLRNNQRPLKVQEFGTPVTLVTARPKGRDVRLVIDVKQPVSHRERTEDAAGGFKLLVVALTAR